MFRLIHKIAKGERGFTLIELLVVIMIIAILSSIAIPSFLGQREKAQDAAAKSLLRNAMTTIESAFVDAKTFDPTVAGMLPADLKATESTITFVVLAAAATEPTATIADASVNYTGTARAYSVGTVSESGRTFGVTVNKGAGGGNTLYVAGEVERW